MKQTPSKLFTCRRTESEIIEDDEICDITGEGANDHLNSIDMDGIESFLEMMGGEIPPQFSPTSHGGRHFVNKFLLRTATVTNLFYFS